MNIRLVGSFIIERGCDSSCTWSKVCDYLVQLPKHCFTQIVFPVESLNVVILVYSSDDSFDLESWYEDEFEM